VATASAAAKVQKASPAVAKPTPREKLSTDEMVVREMEAKRSELQKVKAQNAQRMDRMRAKQAVQTEAPEAVSPTIHTEAPEAVTSK
jgi:hypothetical protein